MSSDLSEINNNDLKKAIIETVAFFDLFDFPPTVLEITTNLSKQFSLREVISNIDSIPELKSFHGQYFLTGRDDLLATRQKRYNYYCRKLKIARRFARLFAIFPAVKAVCLANVIGPHNLRDESDIDFFIITAPGKIWQTRLYCAGLAALLNKRPKKNNKRDKICLSFYITTNQLDVSGLKLQPTDPYFDYWLRNLVLLYNKKKTYEKFLGANQVDAQTSELGCDWPVFQNKMGVFEKLTRSLQLMIMNPALKEASRRVEGVVINNQVLKLYLKDSRQEYLQKYGDKLKQIFAQNN